MKTSALMADRLRSLTKADDALLWKLALPVIAQSLLGMLVGWSDMFLAGQILREEEYIAASVVSNYLLWFVESLGGLIFFGSMAIVARLLGAGDRAQASHVVGQSLLLAGILGGLLTGIVWVLADDAARWMQLEGRSGEHVSTFLRIISVSTLPMTLLTVGGTCLRSAGHNLAMMWIYTVVNVVNIGLSWLLAVGFGPIPPLGWSGIAAGTSASFIVGGLITVAVLTKGYEDLRLTRSVLRVDGSTWLRLLRIGIPGAAGSLMIVVCQLWFMALIDRLGDTATAAHGVAIRCESFSWLWSESFGIAGATLVGQSLGAGRPELARQFVWRAFHLSTVVLTLMGVIYFLAADPLVAIFVPAQQEEVRRLGATVLRIVSFGMPALSASIVLTNALRGAGDTRGPLVYNTMGMLLFRIPLAYALTGGIVQLGLVGAWLAMVADLYARGLLSWIRFMAGAWTEQKV